MSFATEELEISTNAARVDMDADSIRSSTRIESDSGITLASNYGIKASKIGFPFWKASGVLSGERKNRVVAPVK